MTGTPVIGGKADGDTVPMRVPRLDLDGEVYMLISFREGTETHNVYQLAGMKPEEVQKVYKERFSGQK